MQETVHKLLSSKKGILALDWSPSTIAKQFEKINLVSTPELNRVYRQMLLTTPGIHEYVSGVILHDETVHQKLDNGMTFPEYITSLGIVPGVRADKSNVKYINGEEDLTAGIEDLDERLKQYPEMGIKFTKWRAGFRISDIYPSKEFLEDNLNRLVEFAETSLKNNLVPIVEPEVEINGNHTTTRCAEISVVVLEKLFQKLAERSINLSEIVLKTNMVLPGKDNGIKAMPLEVAEATLRTLRKSVPSGLTGIVFLSGGQGVEEATLNLNEIAKRKADAPWDLTFSYARALQEEALNAWVGDSDNIEIAQNALLKRLEKISKARMGEL